MHQSNSEEAFLSDYLGLIFVLPVFQIYQE